MAKFDKLLGRLREKDATSTTGFVSYPLNVGEGLSGGANALDPVVLDIDTLTPGVGTSASLIPFSELGVEGSMTIAQFSNLVDGRDIYSVANLVALAGITGMDTGDVAIVTNTGDGIVGSFIYNGSTWVQQGSVVNVAENGLDIISGVLTLGGLLTGNTTIDGDTQDHNFTFKSIDNMVFDDITDFKTTNVANVELQGTETTYGTNDPLGFSRFHTPGTESGSAITKQVLGITNTTTKEVEYMTPPLPVFMFTPSTTLILSAALGLDVLIPYDTVVHIDTNYYTANTLTNSVTILANGKYRIEDIAFCVAGGGVSTDVSKRIRKNGVVIPNGYSGNSFTSGTSGSRMFVTQTDIDLVNGDVIDVVVQRNSGVITPQFVQSVSKLTITKLS